MSIDPATATPLLALPLIQAAQAQKHVTHNEALMALDALLFLTLERSDLAAAPEEAGEAARYLVAAPATGAWAGHEGEIALRRDGAWLFLAPAEGWCALDRARGVLMLRGAAGWRDLAELPDAGRDDLARLGINAKADPVNRLAVRAPASLFVGETGSHRLTVSKGAAGDTAALLFQTDYAARAEIGLCGDDNLSLRVARDGGGLAPALTVARASGNVGIGTTEPGAELEVSDTNGDGDCRLQLRTGNEIAQFGVSTTQVFIDTTDEKPFVLYGNGASRLIVGASGAVGIGVLEPTARLHVDGAMRCTVYPAESLPDPASIGPGAIAFSDNGTAISQLFCDGQKWVTVMSSNK
ncbi:DUF2793 domain-containing protein [Stappia sp.]|uniref:DUF2793 domain-containing protein n=2 Tax=Alphaproteobacteria TaxID=28211 RepID=UPI003A9981F4